MADKNSIYCPSCRRYTSLSNRAHYGRYHISECNSCNFFLLVYRYDGMIIKTYPTALPKPINEKTPDFLKEDLKEAYLCFSVNAYRATGVIARRTLQSCCIKKKATGETLRGQIKWLLDQQIITKDLHEWANEVRLTGNDCAHPPKNIEKDKFQATWENYYKPLFISENKEGKIITNPDTKDISLEAVSYWKK